MATVPTTTHVTYGYKSNPEKYQTEESSITLPVEPGENAVEVFCAARAMVRTSLGLGVRKADRQHAKKWLKRHGHGVLADFASGA